MPRQEGLEPPAALACLLNISPWLSHSMLTLLRLPCLLAGPGQPGRHSAMSCPGKAGLCAQQPRPSLPSSTPRPGRNMQATLGAVQWDTARPALQSTTVKAEAGTQPPHWFIHYLLRQFSEIFIFRCIIIKRPCSYLSIEKKLSSIWEVYLQVRLPGQPAAAAAPTLALARVAALRRKMFRELNFIIFPFPSGKYFWNIVSYWRALNWILKPFSCGCSGEKSWAFKILLSGLPCCGLVMEIHQTQ